MSITVTAGLGQQATIQLNPGETVSSMIQKVSPMFNLGACDAISNGVLLDSNEQLTDGMHISLNARSHSKAW
jgi:hypothetical protein